MNQEQIAQFQSLETRIADLEKLCRRNRTSMNTLVFAFVLGTVCTTLVAGGLSVFAQSSRSDIVVASEFRLIDSNGNIRGSLGFDAGSPRLYLRGIQASSQVLLGLPADSPTLSFQRRDGRNGVTLTDKRFRVSPISGGSYLLDFAFEPYVVITDTHGRSGIEMGFSHPGAMTAAMKGKPSMISEGKPAVALYDNSGGEKRSAGTVVIAVGEDGNPAIKLEDQAGNTRAVLGTTDLEEAGDGARRPPSSLILLDEAGKVTWSAP
jgi:hypothetical protein